MKRSFLPIIMLMMAFCSFAAITQSGYVKTRGRLGSNGKVIPGQRLANATVTLQNNSSVVSNQSGNFSLTLPANKYYLKNVKKAGYVISDPDMLSKQYVYSANPLVLVLDEPTAQQDDKLASESKLRRNLQKQLQQREDELEALKEENKITKEQYREALQKLYDDQESNVKFIAEMAERYSKIDFDQLDEFQAQMAAFIQNGELVRADSLLKTKGSMEDREAELKRLQEANQLEERELAKREENLAKSKETQQKLLADFAADCYSHFEICKLKFDNDSAAYWLQKRIEYIPDNIDYFLEAGLFISNYLSKYDVALDYYNQALSLAQKQYGENHRYVATSYNNIGSVYASQGDYSKALDNYEKALKILLDIFGENHPNVARSLNNIGSVFSSQGEYANALDNYEKALKICLETFGENHPDVARSYNNMGAVYYSQGDYTKALEHNEKALKIWLDIFGENHPDVATSYNNIGFVYDSQGDYAKALECYEKALKIRLSIYGENHPDTAASITSIGNAYYSRGDQTKALECYEKALKILLATFGENHSNIVTIYSNIGFVYDSQGDYTKALEHYEKALKSEVGILGENHPNVAISYNKIGNVYTSQGNYTKALDNYEKALEIELDIFGETHLDVGTSYNNIGFVYYSQGDYTKALECYEKALKILLATFGENHPSVATTYSNLGFMYYSQEDYPKALENLEIALKINLVIFGENHPTVTAIYHGVYSAYHKLLATDRTMKDAFDKFMANKLLKATIDGEDSPAAKLGLKGEYAIFRFGDWNFEDSKDLYEVNTELKGKPKDIALYKDGEIFEHHFEDRIGILIEVKVVSPEEKKQLEEAYKKWKAK